MKFIDKFRDSINRVLHLGEQSNKIQNEIKELQQQLARITLDLREAIGAQNALGEVLLPEDMTIQQAWDENYKGLRVELLDDVAPLEETEKTD